MKKYMVKVDSYNPNIYDKLSMFGSVKQMSKLLNLYLLTTDSSIEDIKNISFVVSVREEGVSSLNV